MLLPFLHRTVRDRSVELLCGTLLWFYELAYQIRRWRTVYLWILFLGAIAAGFSTAHLVSRFSSTHEKWKAIDSSFQKATSEMYTLVCDEPLNQQSSNTYRSFLLRFANLRAVSFESTYPTLELFMRHIGELFPASTEAVGVEHNSPPLSFRQRCPAVAAKIQGDTHLDDKRDAVLRLLAARLYIEASEDGHYQTWVTQALDQMKRIPRPDTRGTLTLEGARLAIAYWNYRGVAHKLMAHNLLYQRREGDEQQEVDGDKVSFHLREALSSYETARDLLGTHNYEDARIMRRITGYYSPRLFWTGTLRRC